MLKNLLKFKSDSLRELRELRELNQIDRPETLIHANHANRARVENEKKESLAVKIRSELLDEDLWLLFGDIRMDDGLVCYYPEEIEHLKTLPPEEVKKIHSVKKIFPGSRLIN